VPDLQLFTISQGIYSTRQQDALIHQIKQLKFIPVITSGAHHELVSLSLLDRIVFFSKQTTQDHADPTQSSVISSKAMLEAARAIEADMSILDSSALLTEDPTKNAQIVSVLRLLGVRSFEPREVIERHIYPVLLDRHVKSESTVRSSKPDIFILLLLSLN
jgi:hypothetical protein